MFKRRAAMMDVFPSPYLLKPLRTLDQALREIAMQSARSRPGSAVAREHAASQSPPAPSGD